MQQLNKNERVISSQRVVNRDSSIPAGMQRHTLDSAGVQREQLSKPGYRPLTEPSTRCNESDEASQIVAAPNILVSNANQRRTVVLRLKELQARIGLGRSAIYNLMNYESIYHDQTFPRSIKISAHAIGWVESEIETWLVSRIAASRRTWQ